MKLQLFQYYTVRLYDKFGLKLFFLWILMINFKKLSLVPKKTMQQENFMDLSFVSADCDV